MEARCDIRGNEPVQTTTLSESSCLMPLGCSLKSTRAAMSTNSMPPNDQLQLTAPLGGRVAPESAAAASRSLALAPAPQLNWVFCGQLRGSEAERRVGGSCSGFWNPSCLNRA
jgi:hypothetical protein